MNRVNLTGIYAHVDNRVKIETALKNVDGITINNACCMSLKMTLNNDKLYYIYPIDWLPEEYRTQDKTDKIKDFILSNSVHLKFCGYHKLDEKFVFLVNASVLFNTNSKLDLNLTKSVIVKDNTFMVFESPSGSERMQTYYDFCLVRATFSKYYQHIILKALEIHEDGIDPFVALQLGHYWSDFRPQGDKFLTSYIARIITFDDFKTRLKNPNEALNSKFKPSEVSLNICQNQIKLKKYNELSEQLR